MNSPSSYAEWRDVLDEIGNSCSDRSYVDVIRFGKTLLNDSASKRFFVNACEMVQKRVNRAQTLFQRQVDSARGSIMAVSSAIKSLADEYQYVYSIVENLPLDDRDKAMLLKAIYDQADQTQARLKKIAIRTQDEDLVSLIYASPVNNIKTQNVQEASGGIDE